MASFNKVILAGNLTRDPQLKYLRNQTPVVEFGMAVNRKYSVNGEQREDVCFVDLTAFGKPAETINQYCQKGKQLLVEGRLSYSQWDDRNGGGKRSKLSVVVEQFQFLGGKGDGDQQPRREQRQARQESRDEPPFGNEPEFDSDSVPF